mmetsp:Transcript_19295/g.74092  ORF Transcript_19295/g.74092 Transcript_19295/m.74092 type:complete len:355 (+) Transcript_19295:48-1112(+)
MGGPDDAEKSGSEAEEEVKEVKQNLYVTAFMRSVLPQKEPVFVVTVTCVNIASPTASHFEYAVCKTMQDFARLDAVLRLAYNSQLRGVVLPNKKKQGPLFRKLKGKGLKRKLKKMEQYLSALLMADILKESEHFQQFLRLDTMPMPVLQPDGTEVLEEQTKDDDSVPGESKFAFSTDAATMDEIEKNAVAAMKNAIVAQEETVTRLRSASSAKPKDLIVQDQLKKQEAELQRMNQEFAAVEAISEASPSISVSEVPTDMPVMDMPAPPTEPESPREPESPGVPSVTLENVAAAVAGDDGGDSSDVEASPRENKHANKSFRLSMVLRAKKQTLRQTVNFDQLFENGEIDGKYKMA